jgi:hypothetical protein
LTAVEMQTSKENAFDEVIYVLEGSGTLRIGNDRVEVRALAKSNGAESYAVCHVAAIRVKARKDCPGP